MKNNLPKLKKITNLLLQGIIFITTYYFIYRQVFHKADMPGLLTTLEDDFARPGFLRWMAVILLMMALNWSLEAVKWKSLIGKIEEVGFFKALQAVLTGVSISSFTPNRVGEFFGRVFILDRASRMEGILITIVGSVSQLLVTVITGSAALLFFIPSYLKLAAYSHGYLYYGIIATVILVDIVLLGLYFNLSVLSALKEQILKNGLKKVRRFFRVFSFYHNRELAAVLLLSAARYAVFSTQFYLLLRILDVSIPYFDALVLISLIYFIMAIIPTIALTELGIRGSVALYFFGLYPGICTAAGAPGNLGVFAASTLLWMINLGIPALIGTFFVFRLHFFRKQEVTAG